MDDPESALSLLRWISGVTKKSSQPEAVDLYFQCSTLLTRISITNTVTTFYTPSLDLSECEKVLSARLTAALAFESSYEAFCNASISSANFKDNATLALQKSKDVDSQYIFLKSVANSRYQDAKLCLQGARTDFTVSTSLIVTKFTAVTFQVECSSR